MVPCAVGKDSAYTIDGMIQPSAEIFKIRAELVCSINAKKIVGINDTPIRFM